MPGVTNVVPALTSTRGPRPSGERGSALLPALALVAMLGALGAGLAIIVTTESAIARHFYVATRLRYAAEAATELACEILASEADWDHLLGAGRQPADRRVALDAPAGSWGLVLERPLASLVRAGDDGGELLAAWVADDPDDADDSASSDSNGRVLVRGLAIGLSGQRSWTAAVVARDPGASGSVPIRFLSWHAID